MMVSEAKLRMAEEIRQLLLGARTVGLADITGYESAIIKRIRRQLLGKASTKFIKKRVFLKVLEQLKDKYPGIEKLAAHLGSQNMLIVSQQDPFSLIQLLEETKVCTYVKPGQPAPKDIEIPAGPTPFRPGPILTELKKLGLKTRVDKGVIVISEPAVVVRAGEPVPESVASLLQKLNIKPVEVKLELRAAYYEGMIIPREILLKTRSAWLEDVRRAIEQAKLLALGVRLPTALTVRELVFFACQQARLLAAGAKYICKETLPALLAQALRTAEYIRSKLQA
ncbi:MAG: 50S ribosomal protein L10 [bacterium]|nr:50S ribosomal protein L10 [bacterium]